MKKTILKQGSYAEVNSNESVPGIDLQKLVMNKLKEESLVATLDNLLYFLKVPEVTVANQAAPSEEEMANIPIKGIFLASQTSSTYSIRIKTAAATSTAIVTIT